MYQLMTRDEAAALIKSGDTIIFNAFGSLGFPEETAKAVGKRFAETGEPRDLDLVVNAGQGVWQPGRMIEDMCQEGMLKSVMGSHLTPMLAITRQISEGAIEGYNFSMGVMSHIYRASAGRKPGILTKIGLKTFADPRYGGGALNGRSTRKLVDLMLIDGEEYLFYRTVKPNVAILRGTTADPRGNITMEHEATYGDIYSAALAAKAGGGKVIVQVERLSGAPAKPRDVKVPGLLVDAVVVEPGQWQTLLQPYNPVYTGELRIPDDQCTAHVEHIKELNIRAGRKRDRGALHNIIARRAAMEVRDGAVVNLGIGIPEMIPKAAEEIGGATNFTLTVEAGVIGGVPSTGIDFGAGINADMLLDMALQFDFYDGGLLDMCFVGAMQIDPKGNVNVGMAGGRVIGVGGFTNITQTARNLFYCFPFSAGGLEVAFEQGGIRLVREGRYAKFLPKIDQINANAEYSLDIGQRVLYITERCVFDLTPQGLRLIEIAPGISLESDILANMPFQPQIAEHVKTMDFRLFE